MSHKIIFWFCQNGVTNDVTIHYLEFSDLAQDIWCTNWFVYSSPTDRLNIWILKRKNHFNWYFCQNDPLFQPQLSLEFPVPQLIYHIFQITSMIGSDTVLDAMGQIKDDESEAGVVTRTYVSIFSLHVVIQMKAFHLFGDYALPHIVVTYWVQRQWYSAAREIIVKGMFLHMGHTFQYYNAFEYQSSTCVSKCNCVQKILVDVGE